MKVDYDNLYYRHVLDWWRRNSYRREVGIERFGDLFFRVETAVNQMRSHNEGEEELFKALLHEIDGKQPARTAPMTRMLIAEIFNCHRNQVNKLLDGYQTWPDGRKIRMLVRDMPDGYEQIIASYKRRQKKKPV